MKAEAVDFSRFRFHIPGSNPTEVVFTLSHYSMVIDRRNDVVVRVSVSQSVDLGFISQVVSYQKTLKNGIHSFSAWSSAHRDSVEKPASLLVVSLGKTFKGLSPFLCGRQIAGPSSLPVVVTQLIEDWQKALMKSS